MVRLTPHNIQLVSPKCREKEGTEWGATDVNNEATNWCRCEEKAEAR